MKVKLIKANIQRELEARQRIKLGEQFYTPEGVVMPPDAALNNYKELMIDIAWTENIPWEGRVCWVKDEGFAPHLERIVRMKDGWYEDDYYRARPWAIPLTPEELRAIEVIPQVEG